MKIKKLLVVAVLLVVVNFAFAQTAKDALTSFRKLNAKLETGLTYNDYVRELGDLNFVISEYADSAEAGKNQRCTSAIANAFTHYQVAKRTWSWTLTGRGGFYDLNNTIILDLAKDYPDVLTPYSKGGAIWTGGEDAGTLKGESYFVSDSLVKIIWREAAKELKACSYRKTSVRGERDSVDSAMRDFPTLSYVAVRETYRADSSTMKSISKQQA